MDNGEKTYFSTIPIKYESVVCRRRFVRIWAPRPNEEFDHFVLTSSVRWVIRDVFFVLTPSCITARFENANTRRDNHSTDKPFSNTDSRGCPAWRASEVAYFFAHTTRLFFSLVDDIGFFLERRSLKKSASRRVGSDCGCRRTVYTVVVGNATRKKFVMSETRQKPRGRSVPGNDNHTRTEEWSIGAGDADRRWETANVNGDRHTLCSFHSTIYHDGP